MSRRAADLRRTRRRRPGGVPLGHLGRQALAAPGPLVLVVVVVALLTAAATAAPGLLAAAATAEVRAAVGPAEPPSARTVVVSMPLADSGEPRELRLDTAAAATSAAARVSAALAPELARVLAPPTVVLLTRELRAGALDATPVRLRFALLADGGTGGTADVTTPEAGAVTWLSGGPPAPLRPTRSGAGPADPPAVEVALSEPAARLMGLRPGDQLAASDDTGAVVDVVVTGVFEPVSASARVWQALPTAIEPQVVGGSVARVDVVGLAGAGSIPAVRMAVGGDRITEQIRFDVLPGELDATSAAEVATAVGALAAAPSTLGLLGPRPTVTTRVDGSLTAALDRVAAVTAQSAAVMSGLVVVGLVVLALASTVLVRRRGAVLAHQRAVGASLTGVATGLGVESAVLVAAGGAVGVLAGRAVAPGAAGWAWAAAVLVPALLVGPAVGTLVAARSVAPPRPLDRRRRRGAALRRPLAEVTLGLVALAALALLRTRGAAASRSTLGADLVVLAAPTLAAAAVAILLARVLPLVVARMRRLAGLGRGPVALVAAAGTVTPVAPVVALTLACAVLALTGTVQATVAAGQEEGSWRAVGADVLVTGPFDPGLPDLRDLAGHDGVTAVAQARVVPGVQLLGSGVDRGARLVAVDPYDLAQVLSAGPLPDAPELAALSATEGAPADGAVPALVTGLPGGAEVTARWGGVSVPLTVADAAPWLPLGEDGGSPSRLTVVVSRADLERALGEPVTTTAAWLVGPGAATAAAQAELGGADVLSRERWLRDLRTGPSVATVTTVLRAAFVLVAALALLVVALTAAGRAPERGRSVLALRVLGAPRVVAGRLALVELLGVVLPPAVAGAMTGVALAGLAGEALGVMGLTGLGSVPPLVVPWWVVAIVPGACAVAVLAAVGGGGPGREQLGEALRAG